MSQTEKASKSTASESSLEILDYNEKEKLFTVKDVETGNICTILDTFAEMFSRVDISPAQPHFFWIISFSSGPLDRLKNPFESNNSL